MKEILLRAENLTLQYLDGKKPIIENLSFTMEKGEILSLHGPSGAGKSTIVWALMGMMDVCNLRGSGFITFEGQTIDLSAAPKGLKTDWRQIALVPQSSMSALNPVRTVGQTIREMMKAHEPIKNKKEQLARMEELMDMVCLPSQCLQAYPHELSGGMKQRISIALGVMYHPKLLILDEATTGLDLLVEADILGTIFSLKKQFDMSILLITHDRRLSDAFCQRRIEIGGRYE